MTDKEIISEVNRCISMEADAIGKLTEVLDEKAVLETAKVLQNCKGKVILSTFDAICIALMQMTGYTREQFAVIHPGGAVGERLLNHID